MIWAEPNNHFNDYYFCAVNLKGINRYKKHIWVYPNVESAKPLILHSEVLPVPVFSVISNCKLS